MFSGFFAEMINWVNGGFVVAWSFLFMWYTWYPSPKEIYFIIFRFSSAINIHFQVPHGNSNRYVRMEGADKIPSPHVNPPGILITMCFCYEWFQPAQLWRVFEPPLNPGLKGDGIGSYLLIRCFWHCQRSTGRKSQGSDRFGPWKKGTCGRVAWSLKIC